MSAPPPAGTGSPQPSLIATMVAALKLTGSERVLEVGTGLGFQTAILALLADGGRLVHPVGPGGREEVTAFHKEAGRLAAQARLVPAQFVPLVGAHGTPAREGRGGR